jgi:hypothetical protein
VVTCVAAPDAPVFRLLREAPLLFVSPLAVLLWAGAALLLFALLLVALLLFASDRALGAGAELLALPLPLAPALTFAPELPFEPACEPALSFEPALSLPAELLSLPCASADGLRRRRL